MKSSYTEHDMSEFLEPLPEIVTSYSQDINNPDELVDRLQNKIQELWGARKHYISYLYLVNSTGSGKTYTCLQVCKRLNGIYFNCRDISNGCSATPEVKDFVKAIQCASNLAEKNAIGVAFVRLLEKALMEGGLTVFEQQFDGNVYKGVSALFQATLAGTANVSFSENLANAVDHGSPESDNRLKNLVTEKELNMVRKKGKMVQFKEDSDSISAPPTDVVASSVAKNNVETRPLVVFFDEADGLLGNCSIDNEFCPLRCLQRALDSSNIIACFLGTSSRLESLETTMPSSRRTNSCKSLMSPVVELVKHDLFQDHFLHLGRPLWYKQWKHRESENYNKLLNFAIAKLIDVNHSCFNNMTAISLFCLRFGFEPIQSKCSDFVASHLATMTRIKRTVIEPGNSNQLPWTASCRWLSEPLLAEASSCITMQVGEVPANYNMQAVVGAVVENIINKQIIQPNVGDRGEVVVAALMGYTMDALRKPLVEKEYDAETDCNMSCIISAAKFLESIGLKPPPKAKNYKVNFTHFVRLKTESCETSCYQAIARRTAFYFNKGAASVDILIVAFQCVDTNNETQDINFMPIRIQVKNYKSKITAAKATIYLADMAPGKCQPHLGNSELEIAIVVATGSGGADSGGIHLPINRNKKESKSHIEFYGFLVSLTGKDPYFSFPLLRRNNNGLVELLAGIAQYHTTVEEEEDECFTSGFRAHYAAVCIVYYFRSIFSYYHCCFFQMNDTKDRQALIKTMLALNSLKSP